MKFIYAHCIVVHANYQHLNNFVSKKTQKKFGTIVFYLLGFDIFGHSTYLAVRQTWFWQKWIRHTWQFDLLGSSTYLDSAEVDSTYLVIRLKGFDLTGFDLIVFDTAG